MSACSVTTTVADEKDVELDMITFTPEIKLQLGKVTSHVSGLTLKKLRRPVPVYEVEEGDEGEQESLQQEEEVEEDEVVEISIDDLRRDEGRWKVVPNIMALALSL